MGDHKLKVMRVPVVRTFLSSCHVPVKFNAIICDVIVVIFVR